MKLLEQQLTETTTLRHNKLFRQPAWRNSYQQINLVSLYNPEVRIRAARFDQKRSQLWVRPIKRSLGHTLQERRFDYKCSKLHSRRPDRGKLYLCIWLCIRPAGQGIRNNR